MSLAGIRDLSLINTPPRNRLPIETTVAEYHEELIARAIDRELQRGGQIYFVHNRIHNLHTYYETVQRLVPHARIVTAHGQMDERSLEAIMQQFNAGMYDVLLTTVIIENGLDISNVNTIIVNQADNMGLAQLYQLRGRVGRTSTQAYALFLTPPFHTIKEKSLRKLKTMEQYTELGSGFQIAMRDLEIRGTGNLLGSKQHGFIAAVGYGLYCKMLKETIEKAQQGDDEQSGEERKEPVSPKVEVPVDISIPHEYICDSTTRVSVYQQLSSAASQQEIEETRSMLADRFGDLPTQVQTLLHVMHIRMLARLLGCSRVRIDRGRLRLYYESEHGNGSQDNSPEVIKPVITRSDYQFDIIPESPLRLETGLNSTTLELQLQETMEVLQKCAK
jgi:transcription-repair coupling factor (superfamily II helicase)